MDRVEQSKQYVMTEEELRAVQLVQVELLEEADRICRKCGIHYCMVGGTMLGAIRHKGYIPWDDDADLGFLRREYEKFREACKTELDTEKFYFQDMRDTPGYRWGYGKLRRKGTEFIRCQQEHMPYEQGIFIDIFPFDNVPDHWLLRRVHFFLCFLLRKFLWSKIGSNSEQNLLVRFLYKMMNLVPEKTLIRWYEMLSQSTAHKKTDMVRIMTFPAPKGTYGFYRKWYTTLARYPFEHIVLSGAKDYDAYLTHKFGDYGKLPPAEQQKKHPISRLKL